MVPMSDELGITYLSALDARAERSASCSQVSVLRKRLDSECVIQAGALLLKIVSKKTRLRPCDTGTQKILSWRKGTESDVKNRS